MMIASCSAGPLVLGGAASAPGARYTHACVAASALLAALHVACGSPASPADGGPDGGPGLCSLRYYSEWEPPTNLEECGLCVAPHERLLWVDERSALAAAAVPEGVLVVAGPPARVSLARRDGRVLRAREYASAALSPTKTAAPRVVPVPGRPQAWVWASRGEHWERLGTELVLYEYDETGFRRMAGGLVTPTMVDATIALPSGDLIVWVVDGEEREARMALVRATDGRSVEIAEAPSFPGRFAVHRPS